MSFPSRLALGFSVSLLCLPAVYAADSAHDWLMKINHAARMLNYEGAFVYQHDGQLEAMRLVHKVENGRTHERLVSLNGAAREIIRTDREVLCYLPDEKSVMVEHRKVDDTSFPRILPERLNEIDESYVVQIGKSGRVTGRVAQQVIIKPRDEYRYGYRLWADRDTGLLLQADLLDAQGKLIEQFMFTQVNVGGNISAAALKPETEGKGFAWHRADAREKPAPTPSRWAAAKLPRGFKLSRQMTRQAPMRQVAVEHLVYSDGLATISVFIEKKEAGAATAMQGASHMGAVHAHGTRRGDYQITVVGEVPAATVALISGSMTQR